MVAGKKISLELLNLELKLCTLQRKLLDLKLELRALEPKLLLAKLVELDGGADVGGGDDGTRRLHRPEADVGGADASSFSSSETAASWFVIVQLSNKWSMSTIFTIDTLLLIKCNCNINNRDKFLGPRGQWSSTEMWTMCGIRKLSRLQSKCLSRIHWHS